jgi:hypothetical protein
VIFLHVTPTTRGDRENFARKFTDARGTVHPGRMIGILDFGFAILD